MTENKKSLVGIQRYYYRLVQNKYGNTYYVTPRDDCPLKILNDSERFVVITFDADDDYIVVGNKRYYLTKNIAIKGTNKLKQRVAVVDIQELSKTKGYVYKDKFSRKYTFKVDNLEQLKNIARQQFQSNGAPFFKQVALYDKETNSCRYKYEPSVR